MASWIHGVVLMLVLTCLFGLIGCDEGERAERARPPAEAPESTELTEVEMVALMEGHYNSAIASHDALIRGDLATLRARLGELRHRSLPPAAPEAWRVHERRLREAAERATTAANFEEAGPVMGAIAEACGACHVAIGLREIYRRPDPPEGTNAVEDAMLGHQWATERLWEGITGPWDDAWARGANALAESRVFGGEDGVTPSEGLLAREAAMREAGQSAKTTTGLSARAAAYGRLLTTCAACHHEARVSFDSE